VRRQGQRLLAAWQRCPLVKVVGVASASETSAAAAARQFGVERWDTDWRRAVDRPEVDIVNICSPTATHTEIAGFAAARGKHILSEKPIGLDLGAAQRAIAAARQHHVLYGIAYIVRMTRNFEKQRDLLQSGAIGSPLFFRSWWLREAWVTKPAFHDEAQNGDPFLDYFCHDYDAWQTMLGAPIARATAVARTWGDQIPQLKDGVARLSKDTGCALLEFDGGHIAECACGFAMAPGIGTPSAGNDVFGPKGAILGGPRFDLRLWTLGPNGRQERVFPNDSREEWDRKQAASFAQSVIEGKPPFAPAEEGLSALRIWEAIRESVRTGRGVDVRPG
jgi:predicted dehydrogenase